MSSITRSRARLRLHPYFRTKRPPLLVCRGQEDRRERKTDSYIARHDVERLVDCEQHRDIRDAIKREKQLGWGK
ncbi:hypothetical protein [Salinibacter sp. 10B]|uniref:hypothetical protein n=1 Tax=Salinibacter sp. 10B TaxID=1923971 RepID=UPI0011AFE859|nr:hypothetical protein [Salinibacter sp. 10B]